MMGVVPSKRERTNENIDITNNEELKSPRNQAVGFHRAWQLPLRKSDLIHERDLIALKFLTALSTSLYHNTCVKLKFCLPNLEVFRNLRHQS